MRSQPRLVTVVLALVSAVLLGIGSFLSGAAALAVAATTALIVPGTGTPDASAVTNFKENVQNYYLGATSCNTPTCVLDGVNYPASLWPLVGGLQAPKWNESVGTGVANLNAALINELTSSSDDIVIFGFSQGAAVVSGQLRTIVGLDNATKQRLSVVVAGNPNRPNGGIWTRMGAISYIPILDITTGQPTVTDTTGGLLGADPIPVRDIAFEYDPVGDAPAYPVNLLADLNALLGLVYIHTSYIAPNGKTPPTRLPGGYTPAELADQLDPVKNPNNFKEYENTTYVTIPTRVLPVMQPLLAIGRATGLSPIVDPWVALISPLTRVMIDTGYDRTTNPGVYTPFKLLPRINPIDFTADVIEAIEQGIHDAVGLIGAPAAAVPPAAPVPVSAASSVVALQTTPSQARAAVAGKPKRAALSARTPRSAAATTGDAPAAREIQDVKRAPRADRPSKVGGSARHREAA